MLQDEQGDFVSLSSKLARWLGLKGAGASPAPASGFCTQNPSRAAEKFWRGAAVASVPFPRFRATAGGQLGSQAETAIARTRMKLLEAFTPSQPVSDRKRFAGRVDMLNSIIRAIEEQRLHVVVYGERGIGKTSVMHVRLRQRAMRDISSFMCPAARIPILTKYSVRLLPIFLCYSTAQWDPPRPRWKRARRLPIVCP